MKTKQVPWKIFSALVVLFGFSTALAAVPSTLNYQGFVTDAGGVPVDGTVSMTFRIYAVDSGGTELWSEILPVTVDKGLYSVELGGAGSPFPAGLFETPLWISVAVSPDVEMTPRRPVTATAFAFKAQDANTLGGATAAALDQSAHVSDVSNPHVVTAAQTGAAPGPHTVDTNAITLCPDGTYLNGDGSCDPMPVGNPAVSNSGRVNTSSGPTFFEETNHRLTVTYVAPGNAFTIYSKSTFTKVVVIDDGSGVNASGLLNTVGGTVAKTVQADKIASIDVVEADDRIFRYRCITWSPNLVNCTQSIY